MNAWPDTDGRAIARYLGQLRLRCSTSPIYYRQALRTFQEVVIRDQRTPGQLGREVLETWLREYAMHWPMATLLHRARIVNRFLDFLVGEALIVSNPIADLRTEYHAKSDKAIVRSLLAPDPDQALEALRQFPPFGSVLGDLMRNHIALMQARGYRYQTQARWFWRFDRFLQAHPELAGESVSIMLHPTFRFGKKLGNLNDITPADIVKFLCDVMGRKISYRDKTPPTHLRSLFRFLFWSGKTKRDLASSLPRVATGRASQLPRSLKPEEIERLIDAVWAPDAIGRRNYAMLMISGSPRPARAGGDRDPTR